MEHYWPTPADLAATVQEAINERGLSRRQVADQSAVAFTTLTRRLEGDPFRYDELSRVARALELSVSILVVRAEKRSEERAAA